MIEPLEEFNNIIENETWINAKTYKLICPHEYIIKGQTLMTKAQFYRAVSIIRLYGFEALYEGVAGMYFICGDHYFWTMGAPLYNTIIINRAKLTDYELINNQWQVKP